MDSTTQYNSSSEIELPTVKPTPISCKTQLAFGEDYQNFEYVMNVYITTSLIVFGIFGNTLSFITLKYMKQASVILCLRALAVMDSIYLLTSLVFQTFRTLFVYSDSFSQFLWIFPYVFVVSWPVAAMSQTASVWLVVLVTFDRYQAICHTITTHQHTHSRVRIYVLLVFLGSICFNIPTIFDLRVVDRRPYCPNITKIDTFVTKLYQDSTYDLVYKTVLTIAFRMALPVLLVIILNIWIICQVKRSAEYRAGMSRRITSGISSLNVMIGVISCVFLLCQLPDLTYRVLRVVKFYNRDFLMSWGQFAYFAQFSNLFLTFNSSTNFLWYCLAGSKFRETLKERICGSGPSRLPVGSLLTMSSKRTTSTTLNTPGTPGTPLIFGHPLRPGSLPSTLQSNPWITVPLPVPRSVKSNVSMPIRRSVVNDASKERLSALSVSGSKASIPSPVPSTSLHFIWVKQVWQATFHRKKTQEGLFFSLEKLRENEQMLLFQILFLRVHFVQ